MVVVISRLAKKQRQEKLVDYIENNPFITDEDLAKKFNVSIQTIRLDRMELGIPELRERMKKMATKTFDNVKSLHLNEVIGEIIDLQLDQFGISLLEITEDQVFKKTGIARGHYIFAQANSLAVALINQEIALTAKADIRFIRPVYLNERLIAKAKVVSTSGERSEIKVNTYVNNELVFKGLFTVYRSNEFKTE
ncbi:fatty acid biosynthesis transcriptional regulator [Vulcanibacillus modesticaldus]|uniref:Transcription factor FapR n=1 Tax=Vulcanibacillus modesticaldus TaxID=337097 RepID=A0A1D2YX64_9BACI|nr:transcription factor FapR [Vulcanibacillus modesticaldus]OEG00355.1 fatty acid biosynthesis transcriptional regulator [Vulcanibacillus modesticaldus]